MHCGKCNSEVRDCTCPDIDQRLAKICDDGYMAMVWCHTCNKHGDRCRCGDARQFYLRCQERARP